MRTSTDAIVGAALRPESNSRAAAEPQLPAGSPPRRPQLDPQTPPAVSRLQSTLQLAKTAVGKEKKIPPKTTADLAGRPPTPPAPPQIWRERRRESHGPRLPASAATRPPPPPPSLSLSLEEREEREGRKEAGSGGLGREEKIIDVMGIKVVCEFRGVGFFFKCLNLNGCRTAGAAVERPGGFLCGCACRVGVELLWRLLRYRIGKVLNRPHGARNPAASSDPGKEKRVGDWDGTARVRNRWLTAAGLGVNGANCAQCQLPRLQDTDYLKSRLLD